jgi:hypothetical protein
MITPVGTIGVKPLDISTPKNGCFQTSQWLGCTAKSLTSFHWRCIFHSLQNQSFSNWRILGTQKRALLKGAFLRWFPTKKKWVQHGMIHFFGWSPHCRQHFLVQDPKSDGWKHQVFLCSIPSLAAETQVFCFTPWIFSTSFGWLQVNLTFSQ